MRCRDCYYWSLGRGVTNLGNCSCKKFVTGYSIKRIGDIKPDEVLVEDDEGWAFHVGPDFGCVHFVDNYD